MVYFALLLFSNSNISWNLVTFPKIYLGLIFEFFFKIRTGFCSVSTFSQPGVIFLYVFGWKNEYILDNKSNLCPEGLEKTFVDFSNNTFQIEMGIINLFD